MASRPDWAATLASNAGTGVGAEIQCPGGTIAFTFSGTVTDVDIDFVDFNGTSVPISALNNVTAAGLIVQDLPPGIIEANVVAGSGVYIRAAKVPE